MRIKSLELNGFKSFVDKTSIAFEPGVTAVVGPNGCGKSNVVDAIRWAMGEQSPRRLRGRGMEDVIFSGSDSRPPVGMAEVTLTFDNSDGDGPPAFAAYTEIQISRRLYRSGESEYLLNKTPCRLKDIQDFFRDTGIGTKGYTIVEQGHIAEIVSAKPEERRGLIEEAAGISKYKARRREAESKINSTEQNLLRVTDVLGEIRRQINSIERQARKAVGFKRLRESLRVLELSLAADDRLELIAEIETAKAQLAGLADEVTTLAAGVAERELAIQEKRLELVECERILTDGSETLLALRTEIKNYESQIEFGRRERESLAETVSARNQELARLEEKLIAREQEVAEARAELETLENAVDSDREALASAEALATESREKLQGIERNRDGANSALVDVLTEIARVEDRLAALEDRKAQGEARMRAADDVIEVGQNEASRSDREQVDLEEGLRNLLAERERFMSQVKSALDANEQAAARVQAASLDLREASEFRETRRARLASLREVIDRRDDVGAGTRHLLSLGDADRQKYGMRGLVRDLLEADRAVEAAVEAVLAERAEAIVVDGTDGAISALRALRESGAGHGTFFAPPPPEATSPGIVPLGRPLVDYVRPSPGFEDTVKALLAGVNVVDDLAEVTAVYGSGRLPVTFVTPAGDLLWPSGIVSGGPRTDGLLARVREVRDLEHEVVGLDARVAASEAGNVAAESELARAADLLENLRNRHHTAALAVANHEKDLERAHERVKALGEAQESRAVERSEILSEIESIAEERVRLVERLDGLRRDRGDKQRDLDALGLNIGSSGREVTRLETIATERRVEYAGLQEKCDRLRRSGLDLAATASETREWIVVREGEIASAEQRRRELATTIDECSVALTVSLEREEQARASNDEKREAFERVSGVVGVLEEAARELRTRLAERREG